MALSKLISSVLVVVAAGSTASVGVAMAQPPATQGRSAGAAVGRLAPPRSGHENLARLSRPISVDMKEWRLADVIAHLSAATESVFEPVWKSGNEDGLDPDALITFSAKGLDGVTVLERVLEKASGEAITSDEKATWQLTSYGAIQIGPRKTLNRSRRTEVYDVSDLLFEVPVYDDVPVIDLAQVLQSSSGRGGGGGNGTIFQTGSGGGGGDRKLLEDRRKRRVELIEELKRMLISLAEKDQWEDNGGSGGTMTIYQGSLIVDAPDYMHRALAGYSWWPASRPAATSRRYVSLSGDVEAAKVIGLTPFTENGSAGSPAPASPAPGGVR